MITATIVGVFIISFISGALAESLMTRGDIRKQGWSVLVGRCRVVGHIEKRTTVYEKEVSRGGKA